MRIASLLASGTELVCALGAGDELVARSHECDDPPWVTRLPCASKPTFDITGSSLEIDLLVRERLSHQQPLYEVDDALLVALAPDVVLTQTHCEVCAVSPTDLGAPELCRKQVVALHAGTLQGILDGFTQVAAVIGRAEAGATLVATIRTRLAAIQQRLANRPRPSIVCLEWIEPIFHMGNWGPELVELAGGTSLLGTPGQHSTTTPWDDIRRADPEVLLIAPCGFGIERSLREMPLFAALPGWTELRAVRTGRVIVADGNRYFNRSGPSVFESVDILAEILHPEVIEPRHRAWWRPWPATTT
jgi:iron complex transport system substrate-binding protein